MGNKDLPFNEINQLAFSLPVSCHKKKSSQKLCDCSAWAPTCNCHLQARTLLMGLKTESCYLRPKAFVAKILVCEDGPLPANVHRLVVLNKQQRP